MAPRLPVTLGSPRVSPLGTTTQGVGVTLVAAAVDVSGSAAPERVRHGGVAGSPQLAAASQVAPPFCGLGRRLSETTPDAISAEPVTAKYGLRLPHDEHAVKVPPQHLQRAGASA